MPYSLIEDSLGRDARWTALAALDADGRKLPATRLEARLDALQAAYMRMMCDVALQRDDGYIGRLEALACCRGKDWVLDALTTSVRGKPPFLHQPGQRCSEKNCIDSSPPWVAGFEFRICGFLKRNPSKAEKDRSDAQKADSRDARLRDAVYDRDGGCCRYCRSGPLRKRGMGRAKDRRRALQFDHVNPDKPAGANGENYVTACGRCNEEKGHRTPDEAGMALLPEPSEDLKAAWLDRGETLFDNPPDNQHDNAHDKQRGVVETVVRGVVPSVVEQVVAADETPGEAQEQALDNAPEGSGSGRVGVSVGGALSGLLGQPIRGPDAPDIWTGRSRAPEPRAGPP